MRNFYFSHIKWASFYFYIPFLNIPDPRIFPPLIFRENRREKKREGMKEEESCQLIASHSCPFPGQGSNLQLRHMPLTRDRIQDPSVWGRREWHSNHWESPANADYILLKVFILRIKMREKNLKLFSTTLLLMVVWNYYSETVVCVMWHKGRH